MRRAAGFGEIPVNHRPRVAGVSKYGVWNRLGRGIFDLFAMAWFQKRRIGIIPTTEIPEKAEISRTGESADVTPRGGTRPTASN